MAEVLRTPVLPLEHANTKKLNGGVGELGERVEKEETACVHHWLIETPKGPTSKSICKHCSIEREFRNSPTDYLWEDGTSRNYYIPRSVSRISNDDSNFILD